MPDDDPRDELIHGVAALGGIRGLVAELAAAGGGFDCVAPYELAELLDMVEGRLRHAANEIQDYVPRGHASRQA